MKKESIIKKAFSQIPDENRIFIKRLDEISERIMSILDFREWTQKDLAKKMGKSPSEINKWLNSPHNLTLKTISKLESTLQTPIINVPKTFNVENDDDNIVTNFTLIQTSTEVPREEEEVENIDFKEPRGKKENRMREYVTANG